MAIDATVGWPSPAKLNLFLHINGQLDNGYHELQTLFQLLDYGDELFFTPNASGSVKLLTEFNGVPHNDNLIIKAANLLLPYKHNSQGCDIEISKRLPMGGGIGGGSSNAATTLVALNALWGIHLSTEKLCQLGLTLGADVPVFVNGLSTFASGVGEKFTPTEITQQVYLVAVPNCHVSTASVFQHEELPRNTPLIQFNDYIFDNTHNDCEKIVTKLYPDIAKALHRLLEYAPSRMTGTGACVFAIFDDVESAQVAHDALKDELTVFIARGVNQSPLKARLAAYQCQQ
ncbi:MAG: 4-(cytidine 5'-diphospho)-2-C-methyl-D-erythritol kinase [Glaciecola sp.]